MFMSVIMLYFYRIMAVPQQCESSGPKTFFTFLIEHISQTDYVQVFHASSLSIPMKYSCIFRTIPHQVQSIGHKTVFDTYDWKHVFNKPILLNVARYLIADDNAILSIDRALPHQVRLNGDNNLWRYFYGIYFAQMLHISKFLKTMRNSCIVSDVIHHAHGLLKKTNKHYFTFLIEITYLTKRSCSNVAWLLIASDNAIFM